MKNLNRTKIILAEQNNLLSKPKAEVAAATASLGAESWGEQKAAEVFRRMRTSLQDTPQQIVLFEECHPLR